MRLGRGRSLSAVGKKGERMHRPPAKLSNGELVVVFGRSDLATPRP